MSIKENFIKNLDSLEKSFVKDLQKFGIEGFKCRQSDCTITLTNGDFEFAIWNKGGEFFLWRIQLFYCQSRIDLSFMKDKVDQISKDIYRRITLKQLGNDLFFSFNGVDGVVKFTGYNDRDWREKYKPLEITAGDVKWSIDYKKMEAKYLGLI